ncbi:putative F-box-like domain superfamily protein [Helianthus annuus]|uniref:F-box-like domain superfamily protein n=1 Tax=Helianthus annuus TaxID=4232 RepID=A0A251RTA3_HELAN|nr:F-box/FBD/LRR-repeat protein At1g13570 [Helianthus annuus]KAF5754771.1 putative F-box-like domain superfamily protein [Helianthus annuus]KAJ0432738.1 putative F-box-like domain superfamily protein [Helianthus annuus]KAJ0446948.1 putative leucine-rich repeat domain superfamily, F-box-like domain superfamily [Helianthus annuus]KAJ0825609.1 putative F-box-like domain superfamily protein [Helianthus annuus]
MKAKRLSKAPRLDRITTLPQTIIETILCLLPIEEAARTSILSREWRYKWTTIPKLVFYKSTIKTSTKQITVKELRCKLFCAIHQVLLLRQAPILDFTLRISADDTYFEIDQIILHLSRNHTIMKLRLDFLGLSSYRLPLSFFSLRHLTDLYLEYCDIGHEPTFNGFGNLTSLSLSKLSISRKSLLHLLSNCPSLKSFSLFIDDEEFYGHERPNIMELFKSLPVIEHLTTWGYVAPSFLVDSVPQELPTSLIHLKYFCLEKMGIVNRDGYSFGLTFLVVLLKCSPNLERIKLETNTDEDYDVESVNLEDYSDIFEEYSDVWLEHLNELKFRFFSNLKPELELLKFILARSPNLKKVILPTYISDTKEEVELLQSLLHITGTNPC